MAILNRLGKSDLFGKFTHYATICGIPVYYSENNGLVAVQNWYPNWLLSVVKLIKCDYKIKIGLPIFKTPVYITCPSYVYGKNDYNPHFITHIRLRELYNIKSSKYDCVQSRSQIHDWSKFEVIELHPRHDGNYKLPSPEGDFIFY